MSRVNQGKLAELSLTINAIITGESERRGRKMPLVTVASLRVDDYIRNLKDEFILAILGRLSLDNLVFRTLPASTKPFAQLEKVFFRDLKLEKSAVGKYVLVRVVDPGVRTIGRSYVIEDEDSAACVLEVYNYPINEKFYIGDVLIIKEPYCKLAIRQAPSIRSDCPTDIIVLKRSHPWYHLAENVNWLNMLGVMKTYDKSVFQKPATDPCNQWVQLGKTLNRTRNMTLSLECYQLALIQCPPEDKSTLASLKIRLCEIYFHHGYYEKVIKTFNSIAADDKGRVCWSGYGYYRLGKFEDALREFSQFNVNGQDGVDSAKVLMCKKRISEQTDCMLSMEHLESESSKCHKTKLERADYVGPVKVRHYPGKGRGVELTQDVDADTILIISKAFAATMDTTPSGDVFLDAMKLLDYNRCNLELVAAIAQNVAKNPETLGQMIYDLSAGVEPRQPVEIYCDRETKEEVICDVRTIKAICKCNNFYITAVVDGREKIVGAGLFIFPSYLNHNCQPNVYYTFKNDIMFVRSIGPLKAGVELCISYIPEYYWRDERKKMLKLRGVNCSCSLCGYY